MNSKTYLPVWLDGLTFDEQHYIDWIANNSERVDQRYSFLPIRILGDFFCERKSFDNYHHIIDDYFENCKCRTTSQIVPLAYYVAEKAFDLAANEFFDKYPSATEVSFYKLNFNGVYDIEFAIDYETRIKLFQEILDKKIDELCIQDEIFEFRKCEANRFSPFVEYAINARLDIKEDDIYYGFPEFLSLHKYPYTPKKQIRIKKEDIYAYFSFVPEKIFNLGNQYIKYNQNSAEFADFFEAAKNRNLDLVSNYVHNGIDINSIDQYGATAFINYLGSWNAWLENRCEEISEHCDIDGLKKLVEWGANPAIYGVGTPEEPLSNACFNGHLEIVSFLLEEGVNPNVFPYTDDPCEDVSETLLERTERWARGNCNIDEPPDETQQKILNMLLQYI